MTLQNTSNGSIDPVCHMTVSQDGMNESYTYNSTTYYFCAQVCRKAFMADPEHYLSGKTAKRKGFWARYLDRLNKATGGKPP
ncbi:MAG: YHS domain-containing protein [Pseudomonadota bacterium]